MEQNNRSIRKDVLRMRFTAWLGKVMYHSREVDIDQLPEETLSAEDVYDLWGDKPRDFYFENKHIDDEIRHLTPDRHQLLRMIYIEQMTSREISVALGCTIQNVYNQKSLILRYLRSRLREESKNEESNERRRISPAPGKDNCR